jgi:hypothetical protein
MTTRGKRNAYLPPRTPAYVSREVGAAELCISEHTWDEWVKAGVLPPPTKWLGMSGKTPRWRWKDVDAFLTGRTLPDEQLPPAPEPPQRTEPYFREFPDGKAKKRKCPSAKTRPLRHQGQRAEVLLLSGQPSHDGGR